MRNTVIDRLERIEQKIEQLLGGQGEEKGGPGCDVAGVVPLNERFDWIDQRVIDKLAVSGLSRGFIAMDSGGPWFYYDIEPVSGNHIWVTDGGLSCIFLGSTPNCSKYWKDTLICL